MNDIIKEVTRVLKKFAGKKIAIGVSGGRDSVCLLHAVLSCGIIDKTSVTAVHVNHNLRDEANSDELFVKELCFSLGVRCECFTVDVKREAAEKSQTVEQAARNLRYAAFRTLIERGEAEVILTAHHALDNAESVLMHMFRGSGLDGLRGMSEQSGVIVRPLLGVYPSALDEYAEQNGLKYVVDNTNLIDDADRNYIRLNVLPMIEKRYAGAVRAIGALASEVRGAAETLDDTLDENYIVYESGCVRVLDGALVTPVATRYVKRAIAYFSETDVTRDMLVRAAELVHMRTGATVQMNNGVEAVREYGCIALHVPRLKCDRECNVKIGANYIDGLRVDITAERVDVKSVRGGAVDLDRIEGAVLRFRREGDYFTPCGGGRKKLKQYFTDNKIPRRVRERIPLICRGSEVLVVVGMQVSEQAKQTEGTTNFGTVAVRNG